MNKKFVTTLLATACVLTLVACGKEKPSDTQEADTQQVMEESQESEKEEPKKPAAVADEHDAFLRFLSNEMEATTTDTYEVDDMYSPYGIAYSTYSFNELKVAVANDTNGPSTTRYTFLDVNGDGTDEMIVRLDNEYAIDMNWIGVFRYVDDQIYIVYSYEDGYRSGSTWYDSGYFTYGGSFGAGAHGYDVNKFDADCNMQRLFSVNEYYGSFADNIAYNLSYDGFGSNYIDIADSEIETIEYVTGEGDNRNVKITVSNYSEDKELREREDSYIHALVQLGAKVISDEEMEQLTDDSVYRTNEVEWIDWEEDVVLYPLNYEYMYEKPEQVVEMVLDEDEYSMAVLITPNKTLNDVKIITVTLQGSDENGDATYDTAEIANIDTVSKEVPLLLHATLSGEGFPNYGIGYTDAKGNERIAGLLISGRDGSLMFCDID